MTQERYETDLRFSEEICSPKNTSMPLCVFTAASPFRDLTSTTIHRFHDKIQIREIEEVMAFLSCSTRGALSVYSVLRAFYSLGSYFKGQQRIMERILDSRCGFAAYELCDLKQMILPLWTHLESKAISSIAPFQL